MFIFPAKIGPPTLSVSSTEKSISIILTAPEKWKGSPERESISLLQVYPGLQYNVSVLNKKTKKRVSFDKSEEVHQLYLSSLLTEMWFVHSSMDRNRIHRLIGTVESFRLEGSSGSLYFKVLFKAGSALSSDQVTQSLSSCILKTLKDGDRTTCSIACFSS